MSSEREAREMREAAWHATGVIIYQYERAKE
jgi:hypothetical protein